MLLKRIARIRIVRTPGMRPADIETNVSST
jgi:hypothetical protein